MKTLILNLHRQTILFDKPQSIQCTDGVYRTVDRFCIKHYSGKTAEILLLMEEVKITTVKKRLKILDKDIVKNGLVTVNFGKRECTVGTWELREEEV